MKFPGTALLLASLVFCTFLPLTAKNESGINEAGQGSPVSPLTWQEGDNVQINTDGTTELQNEESLFINPTNPDNIVALWRDFRLGYRRIGVGTSSDGGQTWSDSLLAGSPYPRMSDPVLAWDEFGNFYACVLAFPWEPANVSGIFIYKSTDDGNSWQAPVTAVDGWFGFFEDKQWITVDRTGGTYGGQIYVPWTRFSATTDIMMVHSNSFGIFGAPILVSDDNGVQWPTVTVGSDGTVYVAWFSYSNGAIMLDKSTTGGDIWGTDVVAASTVFFPTNINGGIFAFAFPAMDADISGGIYDNTLYIIFSDIAADGVLDLYLTKSVNNGVTWSPRVRINDDPLGNGIDQFHPWISINEDGIITALWLDRRLDPANLNYDAYMAHSFDGGVTWTSNRRISEVSSSPFDAKNHIDQQFYQNLKLPGRPEGSPYRPNKDPMAGLIGEYIGLSTVGGQASCIWTDTRNGNQDAFTTTVTIGL